MTFAQVCYCDFSIVTLHVTILKSKDRYAFCLSVKEMMVFTLQTEFLLMRYLSFLLFYFSQLVENHIRELRVVDDRIHGGIDGDSVIVTMAVATSYASLYRDCRGKAIKQNIQVSHYTWFLLQFWPYSRTVSLLLHYTSPFKVKCMVQASSF